MSVSKEDFLKTVYHIIFDENSRVTSSEIARRLGISNAAVTDMARKLSGEGLIHYVKYKAISLTARGKKQAITIIRKHRLWETFLHRVLNIPNHSLHKEAELLEHSTSEGLLEKIEEYLDYPAFDPHGDPIPTKNGKIPQVNGKKLLAECRPGTYTIIRLQHRNKEISLFFENNHLCIDEEIEILEVLEDIRSIVVRIDGNTLVINNEMASQIYVINKT
jgi:DtxR family Mn-dependent transcriptional regulator